MSLKNPYQYHEPETRTAAFFVSNVSIFMDKKRVLKSGKWETLTSKNIVLVVLVSLCAHLDKAVQPIVVDKLMHQVFVILKRGDIHITYTIFNFTSTA